MASAAVADATATTALPVLGSKPERATLDDAIDVPGYRAELEWTLAEEKRVRRRFDLRVLPVCMLLFIFMQLDRCVHVQVGSDPRSGSVANALTDNLARDLGTTLDTINLAQVHPSSSLQLIIQVAFTLGFVLMELCVEPALRRSCDRPMSFLAKRFGPHRALPIWCMGWGVSVIGRVQPDAFAS